MPSPQLDPTAIFEIYRGSYGTELLTSAVVHFQYFSRLAAAARDFESLRGELGLATRPMHVLTTALRSFGLVQLDAHGRLALTPLAREHLVPGSPFDVSGYVGLSADSPGVREMVERLRTNRPAGALEPDAGTAFIYREGLESAMERYDTARHFTMALAGRARNVAPVLADRYPLNDTRQLLDVGGGTGIYAYEYLCRHPAMRAVIWDRPEVLKVASDFAREAHVADRVRFVEGDMFRDPVPAGCDAILLSNVLHDWDVPECEALVQRCAAALPAWGQLLIHDVFLDDDLGGPLPIALYSAALFGFTEGRAYSAAEYRKWLESAGLSSGPVVPTLIHCGILSARRAIRLG